MLKNKMLNPFGADAAVFHYESVDSTMAEARRTAEPGGQASDPGPASGTVIWADHQTAGRGRISGRRWTENPGDGLLFTVIFTKDDLSVRMQGKPFTLLPLLCGLATAETIERYAAGFSGSAHDIRIKWPNDVLSDGRKLCGILCEASGSHVYAGIGININQTIFADDLRRPAASLRMICGTETGSSILLLSVLQHLEAALKNSSWQNEINRRLYCYNETVRIKRGLPEEMDSQNDIIEGRLAGIDQSGALLIETAAGLVLLSSGELLV